MLKYTGNMLRKLAIINFALGQLAHAVSVCQARTIIVDMAPVQSLPDFYAERDAFLDSWPWRVLCQGYWYPAYILDDIIGGRAG